MFSWFYSENFIELNCSLVPNSDYQRKCNYKTRFLSRCQRFFDRQGSIHFLHPCFYGLPCPIEDIQCMDPGNVAVVQGMCPCSASTQFFYNREGRKDDCALDCARSTFGRYDNRNIFWCYDHIYRLGEHRFSHFCYSCLHRPIAHILYEMKQT